VILIHPDVILKYNIPDLIEKIKHVLNPPATFASGGQNPFYKKGFGFPKIFYKVVFIVLFLRVPSRVFAVKKK